MRVPFSTTIGKIIPGGRGLAFHEGKAVFVPFSVPGDKLLVRQCKDRTSYLEAEAFEVVEGSLHRTTPPCPYYGRCGGCDFQHMTYARQLESKREILVDALERIGKIRFPTSQLSVIPSKPIGYRNRLQLKPVRPFQGLSWGFFEHDSHRVCPIQKCLIASESLWNFSFHLGVRLQTLPAVYRSLDHVEIIEGDTQHYLVDLRLSNEVDWKPTQRELENWDAELGDLKVSLFVSTPSGKAAKVFGEGYIWKRVGDWIYRVSRSSFFQVNEDMLEKLGDTALSGFGGNKVLDLYCGAGFFSLPLTKGFREVLAVEVNPSSIEDFQATIDRNQVVNCRLFAQDLRDFLRDQHCLLEDTDLILMDPPRTGLARDVVDEVAALGSPDVVYVSCDPSSLARDLRVFLNHYYQLVSVEILDLFPQTHHLETVAKLRRGTT